MNTPAFLLGLAGFFFAALSAHAGEKAPLRIGIIGLDTSHVVAFTDVLHDPKNEGDLAGLRVVAAFPGGSDDMPAASTKRIPGFTKTLQEKHGVEIVSSIAALVPKVDAVLLESVDGRVHVEQLRPVLEAGKPVFIDKPLAGSLADVVRIYELARARKVPVFSSSALRYSPNIARLPEDPKLGKLRGCVVYAPCALEPHHPDLFWYGIHGTEAIYTLMGTGCETVTRTHTDDADVVTGRWADGRTATLYGMRVEKQDYGAVAFGDKGIVPVNGFGGYRPLVTEIARFFKTGRPPVSAEETIELYAFMEAADESKRQKGAPVSVKTVLEQARKAATAGK